MTSIPHLYLHINKKYNFSRHPSWHWLLHNQKSHREWFYHNMVLKQLAVMLQSQARRCRGDCSARRCSGGTVSSWCRRARRSACSGNSTPATTSSTVSHLSFVALAGVWKMKLNIFAPPGQVPFFFNVNKRHGLDSCLRILCEILQWSEEYRRSRSTYLTA